MTADVKTIGKIKVDSKGRVSIPKSLRESLNLDQGSELEVYEEGGKMVLVPLIEDPVKAIFDVLGHALPEGRTATEIQRELRAEWNQGIKKEASRARGTPK